MDEWGSMWNGGILGHTLNQALSLGKKTTVWPAGLMPPVSCHWSGKCLRASLELPLWGEEAPLKVNTFSGRDKKAFLRIES